MAGQKLHSVSIRVDGENPEAVEAMRLLIVGALRDYLTALGKTEISTKDKYKGNGLARMTAVVSDDLAVAIREKYKKG